MAEIIVWSAWLGGLSVGLYAMAQFWLTGRQLGASTGFGNFCGLVSRASFFHRGSYQELNNWRLWFTLGIPLGGLIALWTSGGEIVPTLSAGELYDSVLPVVGWQKALVFVGGGVLMGLGARLAGGCTSGHGIFGVALLSWPSMVATAVFLAGGVFVVQLLFGIFG